MLDRPETSVAIDFGTNAEMALLHEGKVYTGSAAAGPAIEGQHISCGMLAMPWVVSDLEHSDHWHRLILLDEELMPVHGPMVDLRSGVVRDETDALPAVGITGTGTIAIINQAMEAGLIVLPRIATTDRKLHLGPNIGLTEDDVLEAGKAIGAIRAGVVTLCQEAGISPADVQTAYMAGASGTYLDAAKAHGLGMIPPYVRTVYQIGNTSLAMARDLATNPVLIERMSALADDLRKTHCMFASSGAFKKIYILEYSYWTEGMPWSRYREFLRVYGFPDLPPAKGKPDVIRTVRRDIDDLGREGLRTVTNIGTVVSLGVEGCTLCNVCEAECPTEALVVSDATQPPSISLDLSFCEGWACRHCESCCPENVFDLRSFFAVQASLHLKSGGG
jgi:methylamine methyltransferase corrinoid protein reductive activase